MGNTITEKIIAAHADKSSVVPGDIVEVKVDLALGNDITAPLAINVFNSLGVNEVFDKNKIAIVNDHFVPNKDINSAQQIKFTSTFAYNHNIKYFFEPGDAGIEHVILPEKGIVLPGDIVIGADSHTCTYGAVGAFSTGVGSTDLGVILATGKTWLRVPPTIRIDIDGDLKEYVGGKDLILEIIRILGVEGARYKALEYSGNTIKNLPMDHRLTMANMAVEAGAKNGIIAPDDITKDYINSRADREYAFFSSDHDADYEQIVKIKANELQPLVAKPHSPENVCPASEIKDIHIDQVVIGSCTNGRITDLRLAASLLKGRKVAKKTRLIVIPGSPSIYRQSIAEGLIEVMLDAGAVIGPPCCGPCLGGHMGILAEGERAVSTTNRNFLARMGHPSSEVYLSNPAVAAASAIVGFISDPKDV